MDLLNLKMVKIHWINMFKKRGEEENIYFFEVCSVYVYMCIVKCCKCEWCLKKILHENRCELFFLASACTVYTNVFLVMLSGFFLFTIYE